MRNTLPVILRVAATDAMITGVVKSIIADHCSKQYQSNDPPEHMRTKVLKRDVLRAKKYLRHACISPVDKGAGRLAVMCPAVQHLVMRQAWPDEPERCTVLSDSDASADEFAAAENRILTEEIATYHEKGWCRIAKLYGADCKGRPAGCKLAPCYALAKLKTIVAAK
eukprot:SAG11_NODE_4319_length_1950_cov_1.651540_4_plen_166_part_01